MGKSSCANIVLWSGDRCCESIFLECLMSYSVSKVMALRCDHRIWFDTCTKVCKSRPDRIWIMIIEEWEYLMIEKCPCIIFPFRGYTDDNDSRRCSSSESINTRYFWMIENNLFTSESDGWSCAQFSRWWEDIHDHSTRWSIHESDSITLIYSDFLIRRLISGDFYIREAHIPHEDGMIDGIFSLRSFQCIFEDTYLFMETFIWVFLIREILISAISRRTHEDDHGKNKEKFFHTVYIFSDMYK